MLKQYNTVEFYAKEETVESKNESPVGLANTVEFHARKSGVLFINFDDLDDDDSYYIDMDVLADRIFTLIPHAWVPGQAVPSAIDGALRRTHRKLNGVKKVLLYLLSEVVYAQTENSEVVSKIVDNAFVYQREGSTDQLQIYHLINSLDAEGYILSHCGEGQHGIRLGEERLFRLSDYLLSKEMQFSECDSDLVVDEHFYEKLKLFLSYGITELPDAFRIPSTELHEVEGEKISNHLLLDTLLMVLNDTEYVQDLNTEKFMIWLRCVKVILRAIPALTIRVIRQRIGYIRDVRCEIPNNRVATVIHTLRKSKRVPELESRLGFRVTRLEHLCRCKVRELLHGSWALPSGIKKLGLPYFMEEYLELKRD